MINERLSKLWHREDLRGFLGGMRQWIWEGGVARVVSEEGVTGKACSSQMRNGAVTCGWPRMAVGGWQAHMQKASAQAQVWHWQGSKRCLSLWEDSQGHRLCWQSFPSLPELTVSWLGLPRFARKGLNECKQCLTNFLLGAEVWGQL